MGDTLMLIKKPADIRSSEITDQKLYLNRRDFLRTAAGVAAAGAGAASISETLFAAGQAAPHGRKLDGVAKSPLSLAPEQIGRASCRERVLTDV